MANVAGTVISAYGTTTSPTTVTGLALGTNTSFVTLAAGAHTITPSSTGVYTRSLLIITTVTTGATIAFSAGTFWASKAISAATVTTLGANQTYFFVFEGGDVGSVTAGVQTIALTVGVQTVGAIYVELP